MPAKQRLLLISLLLILVIAAALPAAAQSATDTPEPPPNCPAFQGEATSVRTGYYMGEGIAYLNANQLDNAKFSFTCIIRVIDPGYKQAYLGRAAVYEAVRDFDHAMGRLQ